MNDKTDSKTDDPTLQFTQPSIAVDPAGIIAALETEVGRLAGESARWKAAAEAVSSQHAEIVRMVLDLDPKASPPQLRKAIKQITERITG